MRRGSHLCPSLLLAGWLANLAFGETETMPNLSVPDNFLVERAVAPGMVRFPMFAAFDDQSLLFVAESSGLDLYAELTAGTRRCRISRLEDKDGDGQFEHAIVFADQLVFPMGLAWRGGRLYVADPPDLVTLEDTDGDGRADRKQTLLNGLASAA